MSITDRLDAALEKVRFQHMEVRAIYLTPADRAELGRSMGWGRKFKLHPCAYRDHIVREGKRSSVYSTHGIETAVPKRLSHRV